MASNKKFRLLRKMLSTIGLSQSSADEAVDFIIALLAGENKASDEDNSLNYPYHLRDNFLRGSRVHVNPRNHRSSKNFRQSFSAIFCVDTDFGFISHSNFTVGEFVYKGLHKLTFGGYVYAICLIISINI
mgnify:CR=1 FL=1